ncbi:MAG: alpha/beta fold hydrolase [Blastocatellia bacterium]|nr:alpha/beta fold hydrolase [Blastocatellia bacterium]
MQEKLTTDSEKVAEKRVDRERQLESIFQVMLEQEFHPRSLFKNRHTMTLAGRFLPRDFPDADVVSIQRLFQVDRSSQILAHCGWQLDPQKAPTMIIVHGLEGSSSSKYAVATAVKGYAAGFNVVRLNQRGCGNTFHLSAKPYHAGLTNDLRSIIDELVLNDGISDIYIAGFSLGGNQTLKLGGEYGSTPPSSIRGLCAVSVPIDLAKCSEAIHWPSNWIYEWNFLLSLHNSYKTRKKLYPDIYSTLPKAYKALSLRSFDNLIVAPFNQFRDADDYYQKSSSAPYLKKINIPTLLIQAKDDPFIPFETFQQTEMSRRVCLLATRHGGHVGYVGRKNREEDAYWAENRIIQFFQLLRTLN